MSTASSLINGKYLAKNFREGHFAVKFIAIEINHYSILLTNPVTNL